MAYQTYTTKAIVCGSYAHGYHDRSLRLFTEDAGMLYASARGLRRDESKLRYGLQDFSFSTVSLVHGKRDWRVTGAESIENFYFVARNREARIALLSYLRSVRRLVQGTEDASVFRMVADSMKTLSESGSGEAVLIGELRLLNALGYVRSHDGILPLLSASDLKTACTVTLPVRDRIHIGHIIKESMIVSHL